MKFGKTLNLFVINYSLLMTLYGQGSKMNLIVTFS